MSETTGKQRVKVVTRLEKYSSRDAYDAGVADETIEYEQDYDVPQQKASN